MNLENKPVKNNVIYLTEKVDEFSAIYIDVRNKENRVLTDIQISKLPYLDSDEWKLRVKSTDRFIEYLSKAKQQKQILDIGCGNGWFSSAMAKISDLNTVIGLDVNSFELEQASNIFQSENLKFVYANVYKLETLFKEQFDLITLNASIQYFPDVSILLKTLKEYLKENGEIHIIDSPFYKPKDIIYAKKRSIDYYTNLGFPKMASNYFHHSIENMKDFEILYKSKNKILKRILNIKDSPFTWFKYYKHD